LKDRKIKIQRKLQRKKKGENMSITPQQLNPKLFNIKEKDGLTLITPKKQELSSEQIVVFAEHKGKKYLAIAPKTETKGLNIHFKYREIDLLSFVLNRIKTRSIKEKPEMYLGTFFQNQSKINWQSKPLNKEAEAAIVLHLNKTFEQVIKKANAEKVRYEKEFQKELKKKAAKIPKRQLRRL
jgi:hypothetical protein